MDTPEISANQRYLPLRIWFPLLAIALMVVARFIPTWLPEVPMVWMIGSFVPGLLAILVLLWWMTFSRATWAERALGILAISVCMVIVAFLVDHSMQGPPFVVFTLPVTVAAFGLALALMHRRRSYHRTVFAVLASFVAGGFFTLLTNEGATGDFGFDLKWRWKPSREELFLAQRETRLEQPEAELRQPTATSFENPPWPGFRGPDRDGRQRGVVFASDWRANPPQELWRISVGPAWSSFAVADGFVFTQEQRGDYEAIVCYDAESGQEVWAQEIESRFFDALGGLGPRATPTIADGSVYALGAEGRLVKLDGIDGSIAWQVDLKQITGREPPMWGYSASPLVIDNVVVVHAAGDHDQGIIAFDTVDGKIAWSVPANRDSYSSPQLTHFLDGEQIVLLSDGGAIFLEPASGRQLFKHEFKIPGYRALQPGVVDSQRMLIPGEYSGTQLIQLEKTDGPWQAEELWTSRFIKPDFNDMVVHQGFIYGFDGSIFTCVDLSDGSRRWKRGRYGKGQVILLDDSDLLLVISEQGELILLAASPENHQELAKIKALDGKTWNHPVVVGDRLYLRNANEAACYQLPRSQ